MTDITIKKEKKFLEVYFSEKPIESAIYMLDDLIFTWSNNPFELDYWLMSPKTLYEYHEFLEKLEKERPLLVELR